MKAHVDSGQFDTALSLFRQMQQQTLVSPDCFTFPIVNRAISSLGGCLKYGEMMHCVAVQLGFGEDLYFCNTLIEMYAKSGSINSAFNVFDEMPDRDLVSWSSLISGYVSIGDICTCYSLFQNMRMEGLEPSLVTLLIMFGACSVDKNVVQGRILHGYVIKKGFGDNGSLQNSILTMYSKSGSFQDAEILFSIIVRRDVVSWNIMISAYLLKGDSSKVVDTFDKMRMEAIPSFETLTLVISSFAKSGYLLQGEQIHGYVVKTGVLDIVLWTSLVDFYAKCGELESSSKLFKEIPQRNSVTWSAMMSGFVQNGYFKEAIDMFDQMQVANIKPGIDILRNLVLAYTHLGALQLGKVVHGFVTRNMFHSSEETKTFMETSILNMYARCGNIVSAKRCFDQIAVKDVVAWTSMIEGYSNHGIGIEALKLFNLMVDEGVEPNSITILSALSACSHSGLVHEGCKLFNCMAQRFGVKPDLNHYTCMVDLLGRSGKLQEARDMIEKMVIQPDSRIWGALLAASKVHFDSETGAYAGKRLLELEHDNTNYYSILSNVHASSKRWDEAENVRRMTSENNLKKPPGWSCIETRGKLHGFVAMDGSHPQMREIYGILGCLNKTIGEEF